MTYVEFKDAIQQHLRRSRAGATWVELRDKLGLPYERACPEWTRRLEEDIGLVRRKGAGRALVWALGQTSAPKRRISNPNKTSR